MFAKKSLGQNFLIDETILKKIASTFSVCEDDVVIEIGPGMGALTKYLVQTKAHIICYEIDGRMKKYLDSYQSSRCEIFYDDFLKRNFSRDIPSCNHLYIIANIPYYITTPIIEHILESNLIVHGMTLLVQKEVAERFCAHPKSKEYGYFTVYLNHFFSVQSLFDVDPLSFVPVPRVMSSVICLKRKDVVFDLDVSKFQNFLKRAFSQKRKTLKNNLGSKDFEKISSFLLEFGLSHTVRAEEISYEQYVQLFLVLEE